MLRQLLVLTFLFNLIFTIEPFAVPLTPKIGIVSPPNGFAVRPNSNFYDSTNETVRIRGLFADVSRTLLDAGVAISVNGAQAPAAVNFTGTKTVDGIDYVSGTFEQEAPLTTDFVWPVHRFFAEIIDTKTYEAYARHQISLFDLRSHSGATPFESLNTEIPGMSIQLTDRGIGQRAGADEEINLEKTQRAILPQPGLDEFNTALTQRAENISDKSRGPSLNACIDFKKLKEPNFLDKQKFRPLRTALTNANIEFLKYKGARRICLGIANIPAQLLCLAAAEAKFCVKSKPDPEDFKLCVDSIDGDVQSLEIGVPTYQGLRFEEATNGNRGLIRSHVKIDGLEGKINGYLRDLSVRWKNSLCLDVPSVAVEEDYIERTKWLDRWATCKDIQVKDALATTLPGDAAGRYQIRADSSDSEQPKAGLVDQGIFSFPNSSVKANKGTCKERVLLPEAEGLANEYLVPFQSTLQTQWYSGDPDTTEALALTKVFSPYKLGKIEHQNYNIFASLNTLSSDEDSGLQTVYANSVTSTDADTLAKQNQFWFHAVQQAEVFSNNARDTSGRTFDISYNVTTGMLNRVLNMRSATPQGINIIYRPTWEDLSVFGVTLPAGEAPEDKAILNRRTLTQFDIGFINIGNKRLEIEIKPTFDPLVYMFSDFLQALATDKGLPTAYGIDSMDVIFKEKDRTVNGETVRGKEWIKFRGGFVDRAFNMSIPKKRDAQFLNANMVSDLWTFNIVGSPDIACRMNYSGPGGGPSLCEPRIEARVNRLIKSALRPIMIELLSRIPTPHHFDGNGEARKKDFNFKDPIQWQQNQNITFYGVFN